MPNVVRSVVDEFASHLESKMSSVNEVIREWPAPNQELSYPSGSITYAGPPAFVPETSFYQLNDTPEADDNNEAVIKYVVGHFDFAFQVDLWTGYKAERETLWEEFFQAIHDQFPKTSLSLQLTEYHSLNCLYQMTGYDFPEGEAEIQRQEWRARIDVQANCKAVIEKTQYVILTTELVDTEINQQLVVPES